MEDRVNDGGAAPDQLVMRLPAGIAADPTIHPEFVQVGEQVELQLTGTVFPAARKLPAERIYDMTTPENAAFTCQGALALGDVQSVVSLYANEERRSIKALLDDHKTRARLFMRPEASPRVAVHGVLYYGPYALVLIRYGTDSADAVVLPFVAEGGRWLRTNSLLGDPVYDHVLKAFVLGEIKMPGAAATPAGAAPNVPMIPMIP
jgi:hypothetical protein